jgi:4-hydroxybenzoyl-CoA reductase subunit beta
MLRLPSFQHHRPTNLEEALSLLDRFGEDAMPVAGGTDLIPNMKHRLFTPAHLVGLKRLPELRGIREDGEDLIIGASETLASIATHPMVRQRVPALALAAAHVAGPQLRNMGTIGGNVCLDTRCTYYNQTEFWRSALGYCLKKDGTVCHVTRVGAKCVAAHSADTPPVLMVADAILELHSPVGARSVPIQDFFLADGTWNTRRGRDEILARIRIPVRSSGWHSSYAKLRQRKSIDFPLLTVAVAVEFDSSARVRTLRGVVTGLGSRPRELSGWQELAEGNQWTDELKQALSDRARAQCRPLENMVMDVDWRRDMVPVFVRRALDDLTPGDGDPGE